MKVAYLTTESLYKKIDSGSLKCSYSNKKMLEKVSDAHIVHYYLDEKKRVIDDTIFEYKRVENRFQKIILSLINRRFLFPHDEREIEKNIVEQNPDVIFFEGPYWAFLVEKVKQQLPHTVCILFMHNVEKYYYKNMVNKSIQMKILYQVTCKCEQKSVALADKIICLNKRDAEQVEEIYQKKCDFLLPINMEDKCDSERINNQNIKRELLFVGSLFPPNYDGIKWFIEKVMPKLEGFTLKIVGRGFEKVRKELERENVEVIGSVDDLSEYYYSYPVLVMPILYGAGMKVKTAEALMYGKTIVGTREALEGYDVEACEGIYECNSETEFVDTINKIYSGEDYKNARKEVRKLFLEKYETGRVYQQFAEKINSWIK